MSRKNLVKFLGSTILGHGFIPHDVINITRGQGKLRTSSKISQATGNQKYSAVIGGPRTSSEPRSARILSPRHCRIVVSVVIIDVTQLFLEYALLILLSLHCLSDSNTVPPAAGLSFAIATFICPNSYFHLSHHFCKQKDLFRPPPWRLPTSPTLLTNSKRTFLSIVHRVVMFRMKSHHYSSRAAAPTVLVAAAMIVVRTMPFKIMSTEESIVNVSSFG